MNIKKILIDGNTFPYKEDCHYEQKSILPCSWISTAGITTEKAVVMEFKLNFEIAHDDTFRIHVSADQQYQLFIDGVVAGCGCEQKSPENWYFESYDITLKKGKHTLSALVWNYGKLSPMNRMSISPGFILIPETEHTELLGTGIAPWQVKQIASHCFESLKIVPGGWTSVAPHEIYDFNEKSLQNWLEPLILNQGINGIMSQSYEKRCLVPSPLKEFYSSEITAAELDKFNADNIFPPHSEKKIICDLEDYYCAFSTLKISGGKGTKIRITWAEAAFDDPEKPVKGNRNELSGKYFRGVWDEVILDGKAHEWSPLSWRCGRFIEIYVITSDEALEIEKFSLKETRYPLEMDGVFNCNEEKINKIIPFCFRTLQMSAHDNFVDCPFYEQLLYSGDGRLECQVSLVASKDDTLARKAITTLASSRDINGFTMARWPSRYKQYIPSFSLWWIGMLYDYALWRDDKKFIKSNMPTMRNLLDNFIARQDEEGFLRGVSWEWNFIDWVDDWHNEHNEGMPPGIENSVNATYNWLFVYMLNLAEKLEHYSGDEYLAKRWEKTADELSEKLKERFWLPEKGLFKEDNSGKHFSKHAQILSVLSEKLEVEYIEKIKTSLLNEKLPECSIFYRHYLFEVFANLKLPEKIFSGLDLWNNFIDNGFKTAPETPENKTFNQRSDCHGWGAHPIYHLISNIAGIKPAGMGFESVLIKPQMGNLKKLQVQCVHPKGMISLVLTKKTDCLSVKITLPLGVVGKFIYGENIIALEKTENNFDIKGK